MKTADLYDGYGEQLQVAAPAFTNYGARREFSGQITTLKIFEDNTLVRETLNQPGVGKVLVVDGGGSLRCALLGDQLAQLAVDNGWSGIIINGCIRDADMIRTMDVGVKALNTNPAKSAKRGEGQRDIVVNFAGASFTPGAYAYADTDGIVVSKQSLNELEPKT
jgi:regulator of ribonuclease activity A